MSDSEGEIFLDTHFIISTHDSNLHLSATAKIACKGTVAIVFESWYTTDRASAPVSRQS